MDIQIGFQVVFKEEILKTCEIHKYSLQNKTTEDPMAMVQSSSKKLHEHFDLAQ